MTIFFAGDENLCRRNFKAGKNLGRRKLKAICKIYLKGK